MPPLTVQTSGPTITSEVYDRATRELSITLGDDPVGVDLNLLEAIGPQASVGHRKVARPAFSGLRVTGSSNDSDGSQTVVLALHRPRLTPRLLAASRSIVDRLTDLAGNPVQDPSLKVVNSAEVPRAERDRLRGERG